LPSACHNDYMSMKEQVAQSIELLVERELMDSISEEDKKAIEKLVAALDAVIRGEDVELELEAQMEELKKVANS